MQLYLHCRYYRPVYIYRHIYIYVILIKICPHSDLFFERPQAKDAVEQWCWNEGLEILSSGHLRSAVVVSRGMVFKRM